MNTEEAPVRYKRTEKQRHRITRLIEALQSGEYVKTEGALRKMNGRMCCLGVGCDLMMRHEGIGSWIPNGGFTVTGREEFINDELPNEELYRTGINEELYHSGIMPGLIAELYGIDKDGQGSLYVLNDNGLNQRTWKGSGVIEKLTELRDEVLV